MIICEKNSGKIGRKEALKKKSETLLTQHKTF